MTKRSIKSFTVFQIFQQRLNIHMPIYQRGNVWTKKKKSKLIDSIERDIDIPKLYFYAKNKGNYDIIDGYQRYLAILAFFDSEINDDRNQSYGDLPSETQKQIKEFELTVVIIEDEDDDYLRDLFLRLQLGVPTNSGEKLNAVASNMTDFVKDLAKTKFMKNVGMSEKRFGKEQVCAQICKISLSKSNGKKFSNAKFEDLYDMYIHETNFDSSSSHAKKILNTFNILNEIFGVDAQKIKNRAGITSVYMIVEEMIPLTEIDKSKLKTFYLLFLDELKLEVKKIVNYDKKSLILYNSKVIQGADAKSALEFRYKTLKYFYEEYKKTNKIPKDLPKHILET